MRSQLGGFMLSRFRLFHAMAAFAALASLTANCALAAATVRFNVAGQSLGKALTDLASQANINVMFDEPEVKGKRSAPLQMDATLDEALTQMLADTGLSYRLLNERTVVVGVIGSDVREKNTSFGIRAIEQGAVRVADASNVTADGSKRDSVEVANPSSSAPEGASAGEIQEVVVTGTHISGTAPAGSKVIIIDRKAIDRSGYGRVQDVLAALPQNFKGASEEFTQTDLVNDNFGSDVQLRGLGPGTTLTLVNGHRQAASGTKGTFVDVANIPSAAVERIEILTDGASAIYGSDAIGGVVNIILRKDYQGAETRVRFSTADGGADETQLSQLLGTTWSSGNALAGYQYYKRERLPASAREYSASNFDLRRFGGSDFRPILGFYYANPGTIRDPSTFEPAYAIPKGQDGTNLTAADLIPGGVNYTDNVTFNSILPEQQMHSAFVSASQKMGDALELFADARFSRRKTEFVTPGDQIDLEVPATNPFYVNPFGGTDPVIVSYDFTKDLGPLIQKGDVEAVSTTLGGLVRLTPQWHITLSGTWARERDDWRMLNRARRSAVRTFLDDTDPETAFNPFGDGSNTNSATLEAIRRVAIDGGVSTVWSADAIANGPVFELPSGTARLAIGSDYRDEKQTTNGDTFPGVATGRTIAALFTELAVPLVGSAFARPGLRSLDFSLAGRFEDYSDFGTTFNPKFGLSYVPVSTVKLRGTWGTSFKAPPFWQKTEQFNSQGFFTTSYPDPKSSSGASQVLVLFGNNANLKEETATVWSAGLDITPEIIPDLAIGLTYFDVNYKDKVEAGGSGSSTLQLEDQWAPVITRNPAQSQINAICNDPRLIADGDCSGTIDAIIDGRQRNLARVRVKGLDFDARKSVPSELGTWGVGLGGTYTFSYGRAVTDTAPNFDVVDTVGNPLALRLRGTLSWRRLEWNAEGMLNYAGSYNDPVTTPSTKVSSLTTVDMNFGYQFSANSGWLGKTQITLSAINIFNERAPFVDQFLRYVPGYDGANATLLGRMVSAEIIKAW
jgi:iron complex outermembrane receptor protein